MARFGAPHPFGSEWIDRNGNELPTGFVWWLRTWCTSGPGESELAVYPVFGARVPEPTSRWASRVNADDDEERARIAVLLERYNRTLTLDAEVDRGFRELARERAWRHPLRTLVSLPLRRVTRLFAVEPAPWRWGIVGSLLAGAAVLLATRRPALLAVLGLPIACRVALHAFAVPHQVSPRFLVEALPLAFGLAAAALGEIARGIRARATPRCG